MCCLALRSADYVLLQKSLGQHTLSECLETIKRGRVWCDSTQVAVFLLQFDSNQSQGLTPKQSCVGDGGLGLYNELLLT